MTDLATLQALFRDETTIRRLGKFVSQPMPERFWRKVKQGGLEECWPWLASLNTTGYGEFYLDGKIRKAHRIAYELTVGPIPDGLTLDHLCRNRECVNPFHLDPVSMRENILRGAAPSARNARATHCPKGHPYSGRNLIVRPSGSRGCRVCHDAGSHLARARRAKSRRGQP